MGTLLGLGFLAYFISKYKVYIIVGIAVLVLLIILKVNSNKKKRAAYLALPVILIGNRATRTYHCPDCRQVKNVNPANLVYFRYRQEPVNARYSPCQICKPTGG